MSSLTRNQNSDQNLALNSEQKGQNSCKLSSRLIISPQDKFQNSDADLIDVIKTSFLYIYIIYIYIKNKDPVKYFNFTETPCLNKVLLEINRTSYKKAFSFCKVISQITGFDL